MESKPVLHLEALVEAYRGGFVRTDALRVEITRWVQTSFVYLKVGQELDGFESDLIRSKIESIRVVDYYGKANASHIHRVKDVELNVCMYTLQDDISTHRNGLATSCEREEETTALRSLLLPSRDLVGTWEGLIFEEDIPNRMLRIISGMVQIMRNPNLDRTKVNWNKLVLLHGPPGCGKTTLCRALAQKLTIRLSQDFKRGMLLEVNTHALLSKWFGESGKLVNKAFEEVVAVALEEEETDIVFVLIDEVETLTRSRDSQGEVGDALRATNQLLTALDKLRWRPNVIVLCTSNLPNVIDSAFLDRVDIKQAVPNPSAAAAFEILRSTLNELMSSGEISRPVHKVLVPRSDDEENVGPGDPAVGGVSDGEPYLLPSLPETRIRYHGLLQSPPQKLWAIALSCHGMSGRTLRRLPPMALAMFAYSRPYSLTDALESLRLAVEDVLKSHQQ